MRWTSTIPLLAWVGACGPSPALGGGAQGGEGSTGASDHGTTHDDLTATGSHEGWSGGSSSGGSSSDTTEGPELPLPPGLDTWGYTLVWTGIVGDRFAIADLDGDGHVDVSAHLRARQGSQPWTLTTHIGHGDGTFEARTSVERPWNQSFVFGDLDGDGHVELLAHAGSDGLIVLDHAGDGRFTQSSPAELVGGLGGIGAVLDVDGDGLDDLVMGAGSHSTPGSVMRNQGGYVFVGEPELPYPACYFAEMVPFDHDDDGDLDLFATGGCNGGSPDDSWYAAYGNDGDTLVVAQTFAGDPTPYEGTRPRPVDFDDDGREDLAIAAGTWTQREGVTSTGLLVLTRRRTGEPYLPEYFVHEWSHWGVQVFGLHLPGHDRGAVVADQGDHDSVLLLRDGEDLESHPVWLGGRALDVADFDEDGRPDLVVTRSARNGRELGVWRSGR